MQVWRLTSLPKKGLHADVRLHLLITYVWVGLPPFLSLPLSSQRTLCLGFFLPFFVRVCGKFDQISQNASLEINFTTKEGFACGCTSTFVNFICLGWFFHLSSLSLCHPSALCAWVLSYLFCSCFPPDCYSLARHGNDVLVSLDGRCSGFIGIPVDLRSLLAGLRSKHVQA